MNQKKARALRQAIRSRAGFVVATPRQVRRAHSTSRKAHRLEAVRHNEVFERDEAARAAAQEVLRNAPDAPDPGGEGVPVVPPRLVAAQKKRARKAELFRARSAEVRACVRPALKAVAS